MLRAYNRVKKVSSTNDVDKVEYQHATEKVILLFHTTDNNELKVD